MSPLPRWLSRSRPGALLLLAALSTLPAAEPAEASAKRGRTVAPVAVRRVSPVHPPELKKQLANGEVVLECVVSAEGEVQDIKVVSESHAGLAAPAEDALRQWEFTAGTVDGKPAPVKIRVPFEFKLSHEEVLETLAGRPLFREVSDTVIPATQMPSWPRPLQFYVPRYPRELLGSGKYGKAVVNITIDKEGKVINPRLVKATYPEFILPALATAAQLRFPPQVMANRETVIVNMDIQFDFKVPEGTKPETAKPDKSARPAKTKE
jgi:TonB family protein